MAAATVKTAVLVLALASLDLALAMVTTRGGFVTLAPSLSAYRSKNLVDYEQVKLKLFKVSAEAEHLKETVGCAPNGYYIAPVYDEGEYVLRIQGPPGWRFTPSEAAFTVNDESSTYGVDVNFEISGFDLSGSVQGRWLDSCQQKRFSSLVQLSLQDGDGVAVATVHSGHDGRFVFPGVVPGDYELSASHASLSLSPSSVSVTVAWGGSDMGAAFHSEGSSITGSISSDGSLEGARVFLIADVEDSQPSIIGCERAKDLSLLPDSYVTKKKTICVTSTNNSGDFQFSRLPCAGYVLVPIYQKLSSDGSTSIEFDVSPKELPVAVSIDGTSLNSAFRIAGISVRGRVVHASGTGVQDALVLIDGHANASTDDNGYYRLKELAFGSYVIRAYKEGISFQTIPSFTVSESSTPVPDIKALLYRFCGSGDTGGVSKLTKVVATSDSGARLEATVDADGHYCFDVEPGRYIVAPVVPASDQGKASFSPRHREVVVADKPVVGVDFSQLVVSVSGVVRCLSTPCDASLRVEMKSPSASTGVLAKVNLEDSSFHFVEVTPGEYTLGVAMDGACFQEEVQPLSVELDDITGVEFVQSGIEVSTHSSHSTDLNVRPVSGGKSEPFVVSIKEGNDVFCVPALGTWELEPVSCVRFGKKVFHLDVDEGRSLELDADLFRVSGSIEMAANHGFKSTDALVVTVRSEGTEETIAAEYVETTERTLIFSYSFFGRYRHDYEISVDAPSTTAVILSPSSQSVSIAAEACPPAVPAFQGHQAVFRRGTVVPMVPGAQVLVKRAGQTDALFTANVEEDGSFSAGPLSETETYDVSVEADGYHFVEESSGRFRAIRLGEIDVTISDEQGNPVELVLVSLSGHGFRSNAQTDEQGRFRFGNLFPDQYYLHPLLKEYAFTPASQMVSVGEGNVVEQTFVAVRKAYSVYGSVTSLNGEPETGVVLHALGENGEHEETSTDATGAYRLRGLLPSRRYTVTVKCGGSKDLVARSFPAKRQLRITPADHTGVDFIVLRRLDSFDVSGEIALEGDWIESFEVELAEAASPGTAVRRDTVSPHFRFFSFASVPAGRYVVRASAKAASGGPGGSPRLIRRGEATADLRQGRQHVVVHFDMDAGAGDTDDGNRTSLLALVIGFIGMMGVLNHEQVLARLEAMRQRRRTPGKASEWITPTNDKALSRKGSARKLRR